MDEVIASAKELVVSVRTSKKTPNFVLEAISSIEDLTQIIEDEDYQAPKQVVGQVVAALAYFWFLRVGVHPAVQPARSTAPSPLQHVRRYFSQLRLTLF